MFRKKEHRADEGRRVKAFHEVIAETEFSFATRSQIQKGTEQDQASDWHCMIIRGLKSKLLILFE